MNANNLSISIKKIGKEKDRAEREILKAVGDVLIRLKADGMEVSAIDITMINTTAATDFRETFQLGNCSIRLANME